MLVLGRKRGESVFLYERSQDGSLLPETAIKVTVLGVEEGRVRLGFAAADNIGIYREELLIPREEEEAAPVAA